MSKQLTPKQAKLHAYLCDRWNDPPTVREMADFMDGVGVNCIMGHLFALTQKGYIAKPDGRRSRGIKLLVGPDLSGSEIEIAGRTYRLTLTEDSNAGTQPKA